jgi:hypothetical protein
MPDLTQPPLMSLDDLRAEWQKRNPGRPAPQANIGADATGGAVTGMTADDWSSLLNRMNSGESGRSIPNAPPPQLATGQGPPTPGKVYGNPNGNSLAQSPGEHLMRIINGQNTQDIRYSPNGNGGMTATQTYDPNKGVGFGVDPTSGKWFQNAGGPAAPQGMDFGTAQAATGGYLPSQFGAQLQSIISNLPLAVRNNPMVATQIAVQQLNQNQGNQLDWFKALTGANQGQQQIDINRQLANMPVSVQAQARKDYDSWLAVNPNASPEMRALKQAEFARSAIAFNGILGVDFGGSGAPAPGGPTGSRPQFPGQPGPAATIPGAPPTLTGVSGFIQGAPNVGQAMQAIYRYDQTHPGFMRSNQPAVMSELLSKFSNDDLRNEMAPGIFPLMGERLGITTNSDAASARNAFRDLLGYGQPKPLMMRGLDSIADMFRR